MKYLYTILFSALFFITVSSSVQAQSFPIEGLGNCRDVKECHLYCEIPGNHAACWSYGKFVLDVNVLGESTSSATVDTQKITFPIAELGNCTDQKSCKSYCEDTAHHEACIQFARSHGLGQYQKQKDLVEKAKPELGCSTFESCKQLCSEAKNAAKCQAFIKKYNPQEVEAHTSAIVEKAQEVLGCTSAETCRAFCQQPDNKTKCMEFAKSIAPKALKEKREEVVKTIKETLHCTSIQSCQQACDTRGSTNQEICQKFEEKIPQQARNASGEAHVKTKELLNCTTEAECRKKCTEHPNQCPGFSAQQKKTLEKPPLTKKGEPGKLRPRDSQITGTLPQERHLEPTTQGDINVTAPVPTITVQPETSSAPDSSGPDSGTH